MFGFRASRHLNGSNCFSTMTFSTSARHDIWQGSLAGLVSGQVVEVSANHNLPLLGVVKAIYSSTKGRPLTHNLPDGRNSLQAGERGFIEVYTDPDIIYEASTDSAMSTLDIGQVGNIVTGGSGNPTTGVSRTELDGSSFVAAGSANLATLPLICIGLGRRTIPLSPESMLTTTSAGEGFTNDGLVEVMISNHIFRPQRVGGA